MYALLFLFALVSGVWLSHSGRPLKTLQITLHKLIALATVVFTARAIYGLLQGAEIRAVIVALIIATGAGVITLFASGAWLSRGKSVDNAILTIHKIAPLVTAISAAVALYLLAGGK